MASTGNQSTSEEMTGPGQQEQNSPEGNDSATHYSLEMWTAAAETGAAAAAATAVASSFADDISSIGDNTGHCSMKSRRKRKDDCSESRCTVTSEESGRSRRRRIRHPSSRRRWVADLRTTISGAPVRPQRSEDDADPRIFRQGTDSACLGLSGNSFHQVSSGRFDSMPSTEARRAIIRRQSMKPPNLPARHDSQSDLDLDSDSESNTGSPGEETGMDEFDADMFARLLHGQQLSASADGNFSGTSLFPSASKITSNSLMGPPRRPSKPGSDADSHWHGFQQRLRREAMINCLQNNLKIDDTSQDIAFSSYLQFSEKQCLSNCYNSATVSSIEAARPADSSQELDPNCSNRALRASDASPATSGNFLNKELYRPAQTAENPETNSQVKDVSTEGKEQLAEYFCTASVKDFDYEMYKRLLSGCVYASPAPNFARNIGTSVFDGPGATPPPPVLAHATSGTAATVIAGNSSPFDSRFNNAIPPEHFQGAMKSSHPPLRPRRSFDNTDPHIFVAACQAECFDCQSFTDASKEFTEAINRPISIMCGKRRAARRTCSRRQTLPLSVNVDEDEPNAAVGAPFDPTQDSTRKICFPEAAKNEEHPAFRNGCKQSEQVISLFPGSTAGSYLRILPIRSREVNRRYSMPLKIQDSNLSLMTKRPRIERGVEKSFSYQTRK